MIKIKNNKIICDYEFYKNNIFIGGMITKDNEEKIIISIQGVIYEDLEYISSFNWDVKKNSFNFIKIEKTIDKSQVKDFIQEILEEIKNKELI